MSNGCLIEAVLERRSVKFHITFYRNTNVRLPGTREGRAPMFGRAARKMGHCSRCFRDVCRPEEHR